MKKIITGALALLLLAGAANAQSTDNNNSKGDRKERRQEMAGLNLTADQKAKMKAIHDRQKTEMDAIRNNTALSQDQRREQGRALHTKYAAEMKAILTPEQQQTMDKMREEHKGKDKRGGGSDGARGGRGFDKMQKELNLTAAQQQQMNDIRSSGKSKLDAVRADASLSQDQKKSKFKEIMKSQQEQMKAVLTPEQIEKMKSLRKDRKSDPASK